MTRSRTEILAEVDQLLRKPNLSREDSARAESMLALSDSLSDKDPLRRATMAQRDRELGRTVGPPEATPAYVEWRAYLANGKNAFTAERWAEMRAQGVATDAGGNDLVPAAFAERLEVALKK